MKLSRVAGQVALTGVLILLSVGIAAASTSDSLGIGGPMQKLADGMKFIAVAGGSVILIGLAVGMAANHDFAEMGKKLMGWTFAISIAVFAAGMLTGLGLSGQLVR